MARPLDLYRQLFQTPQRFSVRGGGAVALEPAVPPGDEFYNDTIVMDAEVEGLLSTSLSTFILPALLATTGRTFDVVSSSSLEDGVVRVEIDLALATQTYSLKNEGNDIVISAGGWRGCQHGIYAWLAELGIEQLGPSDRWALRPALTDLRRILNVTRTPSLATLSWVPQGAPSGNRWPAGGATATFHITAWQKFLEWNGRTLGHSVGTGPENQAFAGHTDHFAYSAKASLFDADVRHFSQPNPSWRQSRAYVQYDLVSIEGRGRYECIVAGTSASSGTGPSGVGLAIIDNGCSWRSLDISPAWTATTAYIIGDRVVNGANRYVVTVAGTSAGSGGPTGTGTGIVDNGVTWNYLDSITQWQQNTVYSVNQLVIANGNRYICTTGGTSANSGTGPNGPAIGVGGATGIVDNGCIWSFVLCTTRTTGAGLLHMTHAGPAGAEDVADYTSTAGASNHYALYVVDVIDTNYIGALPTHPEIADLMFGVGASVADGAAGCYDEKCRNLLRGAYTIEADATQSDQELWRAGRIYTLAKALRPTTPFEITLYAYDRQSAPPTAGYSVNPNIRVLLAHYAYAVDGLPARVLLSRWAARRDLDGFKFGIYDYWALTTFVGSGATFPTSIGWRRYREWIDVDVDTVTMESTYSTGAIGIQIWGAMQMMWRGSNLTDDDILSSWCTKAFGAAAPHIFRMLNRWWRVAWPTFVGHAYEMGLSFEDLRLADAAVASDAAIRPRVAAMQAYLIFLHYNFRWFDYVQVGAPFGDADASASVSNMIFFVWCTAHIIMVDAKFVQDFSIATTTSTWLTPAFVTQWAVPSDENNWAAWRTSNGIVEYTDAQIRTTFETIRATYPVPTLASPTAAITTALTTPLTPTGSTPIAHNYVNGNEGPETGHEYVFEVKTGAAGVLHFDCFASSTPAALRFRLYNVASGALVSQTDLDLPRNVTTTFEYTLSSMTVGYYQLFVENGRGEVSHRVVCRGDLPIVRVGPYNRVLWNVGNSFFPRYLFVPKNVTQFHLFTTSATNLAFFDGDDVAATVTEVAEYIYRITVPAGQDQKVWRWEGNTAGGPGHGTARLLDIPEWTSAERSSMIVPTNLWLE